MSEENNNTTSLGFISTILKAFKTGLSNNFVLIFWLAGLFLMVFFGNEEISKSGRTFLALTAGYAASHFRRR